ncbi:MAG: hypothetical protein L3K23_09300 [Thermoplasmata archaeon]|nr:hypothetical protein [Thermoplasmata archaeon]
MRAGLVVVGVILVVLGAVLLFVPLLPMQSQTVTSSNPDAFNITTAFSPTGNVQLSLTWTSSTSVEFLVLTCTGINLNGHNFSSICQGHSIIGFENGTSGSFSFATKVGSTVLAGIVSPGSSSATVNVSGSSPLLATLFLVLGLILLIVGLILRKKVKAAKSHAPVEEVASGTGSDDAGPSPS